MFEEHLALSRRNWLRFSTFGVACGIGWLEALADNTAHDRPTGKSVIMLWLTGGPATIDLWDLKPGHKNGGPFKPIDTAVEGMQISEHLPQLARQMQEMAIIRSLTSREGDHRRATHLLRTGYRPQGAIRFPAFGAIMAHERDDRSADLPRFVSIAPSLQLSEVGCGFLGPEFSPLNIGGEGQNGDLTVPNLSGIEGVSPATQKTRLQLLEGLETGFAHNRNSLVVDSLLSATDRAVRLMRPQAASAFDLDDESDKLRDRYGRGTFGQGCLLARRLVERGVPFVELAIGGWDTHRNNFEQVKGLSEQLDTGFATLLGDLKDRGLLESTLIVCQGEFGRTPRINGNSGRDHWPNTWSAVLAGGGIRGGQAIGRTSQDGTQVVDHPLTVPDLIATVCKIVDIDPRKQNLSNVSRPIRIADPDAKVITELL
ncbi:hypothetical protein Pan258_30990 [Symmachiella dynata]|uniref:DUF1501 domain-containing protein n=2 Tax=Symmachiella dynata TaxID=2527995 RepID=UPI0011879A52|nr:DUF1501 domain-containing protein [Symmachiella dynata]QDT49052.1 hypothetical protein Pan258_30990 [Symmachiella dynata]